MKIKDVETIYYFAYAHNTNTHILKKRCPSAKLIGIGVLRNFKLVFRHYADIENADNTHCYGIVWEIDSKDLKALDHDEGLHRAYNRIPLSIDMKNKTLKSMTYIMDPANTLKKATPQWYIDSVIKGYREHGLPIRQIENALSDSETENEN